MSNLCAPSQQPFDPRGPLNFIVRYTCALYRAGLAVACTFPCNSSIGSLILNLQNLRNPFLGFALRTYVAAGAR